MVFGLDPVTLFLLVAFLLVVLGVYLFVRRTTTAYQQGKKRR